jgi:hypothetical protein
MQVGAARAQKATGAGVAGLGWVLGSRHDAVSTRRHTMAANSQRLKSRLAENKHGNVIVAACALGIGSIVCTSVHQCVPTDVFQQGAQGVETGRGAPSGRGCRNCTVWQALSDGKPRSAGVQEHTLPSFMLQCLYHPSRPFTSTQYAHSPSLPLFIDFITVFCSASRPPSLRELSSRDHPGHSSNELGAHPGYATPRSRQSFVPLHSPVSTRHRRHDNPTDPLQSHSEGMACAAVRLYR